MGEAAKLDAAQATVGQTTMVVQIPVLIGGVTKTFIIQIFTAATPTATATTTVNFPIAFPNGMLGACFGDQSSTDVDLTTTQSANLAAGRCYYRAVTNTNIQVGGLGAFTVIAMGY